MAHLVGELVEGSHRVDFDRRLRLHAHVYNLGIFFRTLPFSEPTSRWSLITLREMLVRIGAKVVSHGRYVTFHLTQVVASHAQLADNFDLVDILRARLVLT